MSGIQVIARYKNAFLVAELLSVTIFLAELFYLHRHGAPQLTRVELAIALLPPFTAWFCFFPICYWAWFHEPASTPFRTVKLLFFWAIAVGSLLTWVNILWLSIGPKA